MTSIAPYTVGADSISARGRFRCRKRARANNVRPYGLYVNAVARGVEDAAPYRDGCLLFQRQQQLPQYLAGRSGRNAALVEHRRQLVQIRADDVGLCHGANRL